jgi:hypothetical protein
MNLVEQVRQKLNFHRSLREKATVLLGKLKESVKSLEAVKGKVVTDHDDTFCYALLEHRVGRNPNYRDVVYMYIRDNTVYIREYDLTDKRDTPIYSISEGERYIVDVVVARLSAQRDYSF